MNRTSLTLSTLRILIVVLIAAAVSSAQTSGPARGSLSGTVVDAQGRPIAGASISDVSGHTLATSAADGSFSVSSPPQQLEIVAAHYVAAVVTIVPESAGQPLHIILRQPLETVVVTAYRSPLGAEDSPASTRALDRRQLQQAASPALDGKLRQVPGFQLFRRSSSLVANPTTEGISLRGLGSTAASRSLVVLDDVPLNDPYGGWVHWEELPEPAIQSVEVVRGGASDLYGSSAIGGVISVIPVRPEASGLQLSASGGSESTLDDGGLATVKAGAWSGLASAGLIATDGYTLVDPSMRGPIDQPSNVHAQNGLADVEHKLSDGGRIFLRSNVLSERRHNGTPDQWNATRLWRGAAGADWKGLALRLFGDDEHYHQTFSSVDATRDAEKLTRFAFDPADELGAALRWHRPVGAHALMLAGVDTHDVRAEDSEQLFAGAGGSLDTSAEQRQSGVWGEALLTPKDWTLSGSARVDHFSNNNARQFSAPTPPVAPLPSWSETVFDPRLGLVRRINSSLSLNASGFRAYRAPTENELYRTGQVGQQVTLPNPNLRSERATGWETGLQADLHRYGSSLRASYFWTQVNRPITALTLSVTPTQTLLQRENLGQIESRGVSLDFAMQPAEWIGLSGGYQFADATVTKNSASPALVGNWIPQVPQNMATAQVRLSRPRWGLVSLQAIESGHQFDDDANAYLLHSYFRLDAYADHNVGRHVVAFASGENLFDRAIEVGKTPVTTLASPRVARVGLRVSWGE
ncbi:MAG TPA: TonB-dependent receptor [Acidobacteriaceae bacterium]|jgi:outer membrane receptor protein involved in Fe transport|nr:TonB-dependent receptor [Acidobacteriaceae bacterium]